MFKNIIKTSVLAMGILGGAVLMTTGITTNAYAVATPTSFAPLVKKVISSVVNIRTDVEITNNQNMNIPPELKNMLPFKIPDKPQVQKGTSLGSGFIINASKGYVVTNNHVVAHSKKITVILSNGDEISARIKGRDPKTDLAVLVLNKHKQRLSQVNFGNSAQAQVGDWVLAVGNPFGLGGTVTAGIISARNRDIHAGSYDDFIQTDTAINRGNSGGPLFNTKGEVIGVNSVIYSPAGNSSSAGSVGIGFAISSNLAKDITNKLIAHGSVVRGWLGVTITDVSKDEAAALGLSTNHGALVNDVSPNSPASKAGLKKTDVILSFNGKKIDSSRRIPTIVADTPIGRKVPVIIWRNGKQLTKYVTIELLKHQNTPTTTRQHPNKKQDSSYVKKLGLHLKVLTTAEKSTYNIPSNVHGLIITAIDNNSDAQSKGLAQGLIITHVNNVPVTSINDINTQIRHVQAQHRKAIMLTIMLQNQSRFVALKLK